MDATDQREEPGNDDRATERPSDRRKRDDATTRSLSRLVERRRSIIGRPSAIFSVDFPRLGTDHRRRRRAPLTSANRERRHDCGLTAKLSCNVTFFSQSGPSPRPLHSRRSRSQLLFATIERRTRCRLSNRAPAER